MYSKEQDKQKRINREGSYSLYNRMYHYLLDNYEPTQVSGVLKNDAIEQLKRIGSEYMLKAGETTSDKELVDTAKEAIDNFIKNDGKEGTDPHNLGKAQDNSFDTIRDTVSSMLW